MESITILYVTLSLACLTLIIKGLSIGVRKSNIPENTKPKILRGVIIAISLWLGIISLLAINGFFSDFTTMPPKITMVLMPPMVFWLIFTIRSKGLKLVLDQIPPHWIIYFQSFRIAVELILWKQFLEGLTPIQMTFEGKNFDVLAGLSALLVGYLYSKDALRYRKLAIAWNFFGMALLINILVIAILSFPTRFRYFMNEPANALVAEFPVILLPGFLVMIAYTMHYFSLKQLLSRRP